MDLSPLSNLSIAWLIAITFFEKEFLAMRESLSKRAKSHHASPSATPKRSSKTASRKPAKVSLRGRAGAKSGPAKSSIKTASAKKKTPIANPKIAAGKKPSTCGAKATSTKNATVKAQNKPVKSAKPQMKVQPKIQKTPKAAIQKSPKAVAKSVPPKIISKSVSTRKVPRQQTATQALRAFERAVNTFNLRQFSEAKALFEELQQHYQQEVEIISRSQTYIQVCNVRLAGNRSLPRNADEFYDRGVVALNVGNFAQARTFFEKALKLRPDDSHTLYSLAATYAQTGSMDQALRYLEQAVQKQPRLRQRALQDTDFSMLKDNRRFLELLGATSPFDLLDARRDYS
ncbi:MAG TPA: tetratricopeptide repeat protein [Blastocatellia bacterium]|nr:tetratricopeptide repeat protein [Blastocatellia bacterium]